MERSTRRIYNRPVRKIFGSPSFQGSARGDQYLLIVVGGGGVDEGNWNDWMNLGAVMMGGNLKMGDVCVVWVGGVGVGE